MSKKLKLLYDGNLFCLKGRTGLYRVAVDLLKSFSDSHLFELTLIQPTFQDPTDFPLSGLTWVQMPFLKKMMEYEHFSSLNDSQIKKEYHKYYHKMSSYDAYFSPFFPVPDVASKAGLITGLFVHDMIPVFEPQYATDSVFAERYSLWMKYNSSDFVAVNSKWTEAQYLKFRPDYEPTKMVLSYLGAEKRFKPRAKEEVERIRKKYHIPNRKYILSVGEITQRKNLSHLLKAFIHFLKMSGSDDVCLVLTGPKRAGEKDIFENTNSLNKYRHKIIQTGYVDDMDMPILYSGALFFAYLSLSEGFGLPVLEAMQCKTPVIISNLTSLPEVGGDAASYVSGRDIKETAQVLFKVYSDPILRQDMIAKGVKQASMFSCEKTAAKIIGKFLSLSAEK